MIFLLLSIVSSSLISVLFRYFGIFRVTLLPAITINYFIASLSGFIHYSVIHSEITIPVNWLPVSGLIALLFISLFYLMARTTQTAGISVTTNASKMSMIIPVIIFALLYQNENLSALKIFGILLALAGIHFTAQRSGEKTKSKERFWPLLLFLGTGLLDYLLAHANQYLLNSQEDDKLFTTITFFFALIAGLIISTIALVNKKTTLNRPSLIGGIILGLLNYGSIYFLLRTYSSGFAAKTVILPVNNMGIMVFSVFLSIGIFKEKLSRTNRVGIVLSLLAISIIFFV